MTLLYFARGTNITVEITGYSNGQYVVRLLGRQLADENLERALVAVSISDYQCDGEWQDVPCRKVREMLAEKVEWDQELA